MQNLYRVYQALMKFNQATEESDNKILWWCL